MSTVKRVVLELCNFWFMVVVGFIVTIFGIGSIFLAIMSPIIALASQSFANLFITLFVAALLYITAKVICLKTAKETPFAKRFGWYT